MVYYISLLLFFENTLFLVYFVLLLHLFFSFLQAKKFSLEGHLKYKFLDLDLFIICLLSSIVTNRAWWLEYLASSVVSLKVLNNLISETHVDTCSSNLSPIQMGLFEAVHG